MVVAKNMMTTVMMMNGGDKSSKLELPNKEDHKYFKSALFVKKIQIKSRTLFQHDKRNQQSWWGHA